VRKAVFLDRDGVINEEVENLARPEDFRLIEGAAEAILRLNADGYLVVVATNQPAIAKGFASFKDMDRIHERMMTLLAESGARVDAVYVCPHHPEKGFPGEIRSLKVKCGCRKPEPGLMLKAMRELEVDANGSWMVGDSPTDVEAGRKAGLKTILVGKKAPMTGECLTTETLSEAVDIITGNGRKRRKTAYIR